MDKKIKETPKNFDTGNKKPNQKEDEMKKIQEMLSQVKVE